MTDLVERLRKHDDERLYREADILMSEAADELTRLRAEVATLEHQLRAAKTITEAPAWWHCDTHGPGTLHAWGCPECTRELRRWKSTNAPRLDALQGLLTAAQHEAHAGREAVASLASEREANALLTAEVEALRDDAPHVAYSQGVADGRAAERERCAKLCEDLRWPAWVESTTDAREAMAEAIRGVEP